MVLEESFLVLLTFNLHKQILLQYININGKIKPAGTLTPEDIEIINTEIDLTNTPDQIQPFDVVDLYIDDKKIYSNYHLTDFDVYQKILYGEFDKVVLKPHAGRDLNPTMITFDAVYNKEDENGNIETIIIPNRNFYDIRCRHNLNRCN